VSPTEWLNSPQNEYGPRRSNTYQAGIILESAFFAITLAFCSGFFFPGFLVPLFLKRQPLFALLELPAGVTAHPAGAGHLRIA
jgi:hypothetical protein